MAIIDDVDALTAIVKNLMGASSSNVSDDGFSAAISQALAELKWTLPCDDSLKCYWITERARRHVTYVLLVESAHKFRFKEIHLHNRFKHYHDLIKLMDKQFEDAIENDPTLFDVGTFGEIAIYLTSGFNYDYFGNDMSYSEWY